MVYHSKKNKKGTIFCVHGNSSSSRVFDGIRMNPGIDYDVIAIDLPGHGENQRKEYGLSDFSFRSNKAYLKKHLSKVNGEVLLVGNSLGGHLAIEVAPEANNVIGLVIMGTPPLKSPVNFEEAFYPIPELNLFFQERPDHAELTSIPKVALVNKEQKEILIDDFIRTNPKVRKSIAQDLAESVFEDEYTIFKNLKIPKFIVQGDKDPSVNKEYLKEVYLASEGNCELIILESCGHYPSIDNTEAFLSTLQVISNKVFNN